jgi:hypothetical protein
VSVLQGAIDILRGIETELLSSGQEGCLDATRLAESIHRVVELLSGEDAQWIGTTEAKRLLGVSSENTVKAWARLGLLRSRTLPNGRVQILLEDLQNRQAEMEDVAAIGGDELSPDELRTLRESRPGTTPWQRDKTGPLR